MTYAALEAGAKTRHLSILGGFHPDPDDNVPNGCRTLLMLGPDEPDFWAAFTQSSEYCDGNADPMDRWSERVIAGWASDLGATPMFPFGGPPYLPFYSWATRSGRTAASPVQFLVHDRAGLFVSFRGALALPVKVELPTVPTPPCQTCSDEPCKTACPVSALTPAGYDVAACKTYLDTSAGADCVENGCAVRRACPVSQKFGRLPAQSAYHMRQFKGDLR